MIGSFFLVIASYNKIQPDNKHTHFSKCTNIYLLNNKIEQVQNQTNLNNR